jgi:DNA-binding transcriptional ArsR family regulator
MISDAIRLASANRKIYSRMAMQHASGLDRTFQALADGTRRSMIQALARGEARSAGELGRRFRSAQPTISKHLKVLERAGLVERAIDGRVHRFRLRRKPLQDAEGWIARHQAFWTGAVEQLDRLLSEVARDDRR